MNICVIGATGKLGRALMQMPNTVVCPVRFEHHTEYDEWFDSHPRIATVWHVARACRRSGIRRDYKTFTLEKNAMQSLLKTRAKDCRFVFASTKTVYGITSETTPLSANTIATNFVEPGTGIWNCPEWKSNTDVNLSRLGTEHKVYAITKLVCEKLVMKRCKDYKILRIWDIL